MAGKFQHPVNERLDLCDDCRITAAYRIRWGMRRLAALLIALGLAACATEAPSTRPGAAGAQNGHFYPGLTCAPFARALSGVVLSGDGADWWAEAAGRYPRSQRPAVGSILVFRRNPRLASGHVSVVSRVIDARHISVIHGNWVPRSLDKDQLVVDVSAHNDWTAVRVWYPPSNQLGARSEEHTSEL